MSSWLKGFAVATGILAFYVPVGLAQTAAPSGPNSDPTYQQLRNIGPGSEAYTVKDFVLKRDAATFHLHSGTVCFVPAVQGKVTGAVFAGDGSMSLDPPIAMERHSLSLLSKSPEFAEDFNGMVMRFTDSTYDEIKKAGVATTSACATGLLHDAQNALRHGPVLKYNLDARILQDVLSSEPGGLFFAFIAGKHYDSKELFMIDPRGAMNVEPEEVELMTYDENKLGIWAAFHLAQEYKSGTASSTEKNGVIHIEHQLLDTTFERNAELNGKATTTFVSRFNGLRVVPLDLFPTLRVQSVALEGGQPLSFIQEDKNDDADFSVILPKPLSAGEKATIVTTYAGKGAVANSGGGNYYPIARENWYPNEIGNALSDYTSFDMTFHIPKGMKIAATGTPVSDKQEGKEDISVWKSEVPQTLAGFNFGQFKMQEAKLPGSDFDVQSFANEEPPDWVKAIQERASGDDRMGMGGGQPEVALGTMGTTPMLKTALAEAEGSVQLYTAYFGPDPYKRVAVTQQTACNYGQSWPTLVWLPICSFFDSTVRHGLGIDWGVGSYWSVVGPHEVAHQWWGQNVGIASYRDNWLSEGFADMSASLYLEFVEKDRKKYLTFWNEEKKAVVEKNQFGFRPNDVGPITMGYRLETSRTGFNVARDLIYPKGAYILQMIRMMMWNRQTGDKDFIDLMHDYSKTYSGRAASTEDFKAMVEKHMTREMNVAGNGKMDWFFNEYVYGTQLPSYSFTSSFDKDAQGNVVFNYDLNQSGVDNDFVMLVPVYFEIGDGRYIMLGHIVARGSQHAQGKVTLEGLKDAPQRAVINYNYDVLATN